MGNKKSVFSASSKAVDPAIEALFAASSGPVTAPPKSRYAEPPAAEVSSAESGSGDEDQESVDAEQNSSDEESIAGPPGDGSEEEPSSVEDQSQEGSDDEKDADIDQPQADIPVAQEAVTGSAAAKSDRKRKRTKYDKTDQLESNHLQRLADVDDDEDQPAAKRRNGSPKTADRESHNHSLPSDDDDNGDEVPLHESISEDPSAAALEQASRTVFLSNVSTEAITSRKAKKTLLAHLSSILDTTPDQRVESLRFRSTAFSSAALPKRAAFIKHSLMGATTKSTNAYAVYSDAGAVRAAVARLNGTVVLDRHLRVDGVAHPAAVDHRRCVFVGNLGFVDDESVLNPDSEDEDGDKQTKKKRRKQPMDVEEGLWRVFGKAAGRVESVRVVRDAATRVGKGFAYVQFYDANAVEAALLLSGKVFPPLLPRALRVSRCKAPHKTVRAMEAKQSSRRDDGKPSSRKATTGRNGSSGYVPKPTAEAQTLAGRAGKLLGRAHAARTAAVAAPGSRKEKVNGRAGAGRVAGFKSPEDIVFEGRRASAKDGKPKDLRFKGAQKGGKAGVKKSGRKAASAARAAKWKAQGGRR